MLKKLLTFGIVMTTIVWSMGVAAFVPAASAVDITSGDLIKGSGTTVYYYGADGQRYTFPYSAVYQSWFGTNFSSVKTLTDAEVVAIPRGGNVTIRPGKLAQIVNMETPWQIVDPKVYSVSQGAVLNWVTSGAIATSVWGASWESLIYIIPEALWSDYTLASDLTDASQYDLAAELAVSTINQDKGLEGIPQGQGNLTVSLASDTPAAASVPMGAADVSFTKVNFTAGSTDVTVTGLKVTRSGLGADANMAAVKLYVDGVMKGTSQTLGSTHQATFNLSSSPIVIPAGTTKAVILAADMSAAPAAFDQHVLGIANISDITTTSTIGGTFPINGNVMSLVNVTIGTATLYNGSLNPTADTGIDPAAIGFRFTQVKISAGSTEALNIDQISAVKNGTAANTDVKNITLFNDTTGTTLGTVESLDANGRAVFSGLALTIAKGGYVELSIKADMNGGSGRTISFDLHDGTTYTMMIKGVTYNAGITPVRNNFCAVNGTCQTQSINQGYLTVSKSPSAPATGKIALGGSGVAVMAFDFTAAGEPINVTKTILNYTTTGATVGKFTNWTLYKADGSVLAGPKNRDQAIADVVGTDTITFTDSFALPVGTTVIYVKVDVDSAAAALDTVHLDMAAGTITAKGSNSGKVTYTTSAGVTVPSASVITGNTMTLQGPALSILTAATPVASTIVGNAQDQVFAYIDLDPSAGGEDIRVSQIIVSDTMTVGATATELLNLELWGDPDNTDATAENVRLVTSNSTATNGATTTFTFQTPIVVSQSATSRLTLKADVDGNLVAGGEKHAFNVITPNVTATGKSTGNTAVKTYSGVGQEQTLQPKGRLAVAPAADLPVAAQLVSSSLNNSVMKYKFSATFEPVDVTEIPVFVDIGAYPGHIANVARIYVYADGVIIGNTGGYTVDPATGLGLITLNSGTLVIPKDGYKTVEFKIDVSPKDQVDPDLNNNNTVTTNTFAAPVDEFYFGIGDSNGDATEWTGAGNYDIAAVGQSSGATMTKTSIDHVGDGSGNVYGSAAFTIHKGILTVSLNSTTPSGTQTAGAGKDVLKLNLVATGDDITVSDIYYAKGGTGVITGVNDAKWCNEDATTTYHSWTGATAWLNAGRDWSAGVVGATLQVAAGTTKVIKLNGDTTGAVNPNTLQFSVKVGGALASGIKWADSSNNAGVPVTVDLTTTKNLPVDGGGMSY